MADGGDDPSDNPFSFNNFRKKNDASPSDNLGEASSDEREDILDMPDVQNIVVNEENRSRQRAFADDDRHRRKEDNPFSFKKFLKNTSRPKGATGGLATLDLANDLPDFIIHHGSSATERQGRSARMQPPEIPLPDFALDSSSAAEASAAPSGGLDGDIGLGAVGGAVDLNAQPPPPDLSPRLPGFDLGGAGLMDFSDARNGARSKMPSLAPYAYLDGIVPDIPGHVNGHMSHSDAEEEDVAELADMRHANATGGLPDFLSDSAVNSVDMRSMDKPVPSSDSFHYQANGDLEMELRRLQEENRDLRSQLNAATALAESESRRVAIVQEEMEALEKREAADTAALEKMMQQVEANLTTTTQRAVQAEATVTKLKQEIKTLQAQLQTSSRDSHAECCSNDIVKQKAKYASEQISSAAKTAEQTLQQLLGGVETLKLVSSVLSSIDKISDVDTNDPPEGDTDDGAGASV